MLINSQRLFSYVPGNTFSMESHEQAIILSFLAVLIVYLQINKHSSFIEKKKEKVCIVYA